MTRDKNSPAPTPRRRWLKWLSLTVLALLILPIVQVGCVRLADPPLTPLMLLRPIEARWNKKPPNPRHYSWIARSRMPPDFLKAVILSEDQRFFEHHGFDWKEVKIARRQAARRGKPPRGASTISMQCAMLAALLPNPRQWNPRAPNETLKRRQAKILRADSRDALKWAP
jgi:monofunctional glycosyltransferase